MSRSSYFSHGTLQKDRALPALSPDFVLPEEKSVGDFLVFVRQFSQIIRYWNEQNNPQGNWEIFFEDDLSILLAYIGHVNTSRYPKEHDSIATHFQHTTLEYEKEHDLVRLLLLNLNIEQLINNWYDLIRTQASLNSENDQIEELIVELITANAWNGSLYLMDCYRNMNYSFQQNPSQIAQEPLGQPVHKAQLFFEQIFAIKGTSDGGQQNEIPQVDFSNYDGFFNYLDQLYHSLYGTIAQIQQSIPAYLEQSLQLPNHSSHVSLLLAFWGMMEQTQQLINGFTGKHLDFYYQQVLQQQLAGSTPDQVLLYFGLTPARQSVFLAAGTPFLAGKSPSGPPLLYTLDKDLSVNEAQTSSYKTIFNDTANAPLYDQQAHLIYASPIANSEDGLGGKFLKTPPSWPTLGQNENSPDATNLAQLGFAVSNPLLYLSEGSRQITLMLHLSQESVEYLEQQYITFNLKELSYWEALESLIHQSFTVSYTGPKGWVAPSESASWIVPYIDEQAPKTQQNKAGLAIAFFLLLKPSQPALSSYDPKKHGTGYTTPDPLLRFEVNQTACIHPVQLGLLQSDGTPCQEEKLYINPQVLLSKLRIVSMPLYVEVEDVQDFVVQNDHSVLNPKKPYPPFGTAPIVNSHFYVGNSELFCKPLTYLKLHIDWYDLPKLDNGFCEYYRDYNIFEDKKPFYNSVFKWQIDLLQAKDQAPSQKWHALDFTAEKPREAPADAPPPRPGNGDNAYDLAPPKSIDTTITKDLLTDVGAHYGPHWKTNSQEAPKQYGDYTPAYEDALSPRAAQDLLVDVGSFYGPHWKTNSTRREPQPNAAALTNETAKDIIDDLSRFLGPNWKTNRSKLQQHSASPKTTNDSQAAATKAPKNQLALDLARSIVNSLNPTGSPSEKQTGKPDSDAKKSAICNDCLFRWSAAQESTAQTDEQIEKQQLRTEGKQLEEKAKKISENIHLTVRNLLDKADSILQDATKAKSLLNDLKDVLDNKASSSEELAAGQPVTLSSIAKPSIPDSPNGDQPKPPGISCPYQKEGKLKDSSELFIQDFQNIEWKNVSSASPFSTKTTFSDQSEDGFLRFTLTSPEYAFGEAEYPRVVAAVANFNMELIANKLKKKSNGSSSGSGQPSDFVSRMEGWMQQIDKLLTDPALQIILEYGGQELKDSFISTQNAYLDAIGRLRTKDPEKQAKNLSTDLYIILNFLYLLRIILDKLSFFVSQDSSGKDGENSSFLDNIISTISGLPLLKKLMIPLGWIGSLLHLLIGLLGSVAKEEEVKLQGLILDYNTALSATQFAIADVEAVIISQSGSDSPIPGINKPLLPPRPAFVPKISSLTADYKAKDQISFQPDAQGNASFFYLQPFGIELPTVANQSIQLQPSFDAEGYLFLALEKTNAPQKVTLLFELNAESGDRDLPLPAIEWSYLDGSQWLPFAPTAVKDGTNGFSQSGIISFQLPFVQAPSSTAPEYWLRASADKNATAVCEIIQVYAQAGTATYASGELDPSHFDAPLAAKKISKAQKNIPGIAKIVQPLPSTDGRAAEQESGFYRRVNERLRHKDRAVNSWDYERLILQQFPNIALVKCLNHCSLQNSNDPGSISIVLLPDSSAVQAPSLSPKTDQGQIANILSYIQGLSDPFAKIYVRNPQYQYLKVELSLQLTEGLDPGHYLKLLNQGLIQTIAPWSVDYQGINPFETKLSYFSILEYINRQSYIHELAKFTLWLLPSEEATEGRKIAETFDTIQPKEPWIILSSVDQHQLSIATEAELIAAHTAPPPIEQRSPVVASPQKDADSILPDPKVLNALYIGNDLYTNPN